MTLTIKSFRFEFNDPQFEDITKDNKSIRYANLMKEIFDLFRQNNEAQIINVLKDDLPLLSRQFKMLLTQQMFSDKLFGNMIKSRKYDPLFLSCLFCARKVFNWIITNSESWREGRKYISVPTHHTPAPLHYLIEEEDIEDELGHPLFDDIMNKPIQLYEISKNTICTHRSLPHSYIPNHLSDKDLAHELTFPKPTIIANNNFEELKIDPNYLLSDTYDESPFLIFNAVTKGKRFMFERILGFYCKQDHAHFNASILSNHSRLPLVISQIILDYALFIVTEKVKNIATLTRYIYSQKFLETPFTTAIYQLRKINQNQFHMIKKYIEIAKLLLECGETINRISPMELNPIYGLVNLLPLPPGFLARIQTTCVESLLKEITESFATQLGIKHSNKNQN